MPLSEQRGRCIQSAQAVLVRELHTSARRHAKSAALQLLPQCLPQMGNKNYKPRETVAKLLILLVPRKGFEPPTPALRMRCSTG